MAFYHYIYDFKDETDPKDWNVLTCLRYLKDKIPFSSDSRQEILDAFVKVFKKVNESTFVHVGVRKKAQRLYESANDTFQRIEVIDFFEDIDHEFDVASKLQLLHDICSSYLLRI